MKELGALTEHLASTTRIRVTPLVKEELQDWDLLALRELGIQTGKIAWTTRIRAEVED